MRFFDLFAGIGGFRFGLERVGFKCVGWSENDKFARASYEAIFDTEGEWFEKDARKIEPDELPEFEVLTAGFPCQSFSVSGNRRGFKDTRGTLFFEIARIAKETLPQILLLENVKGLLNHSNGETFRKILETLDELGYDATWELLNSKNFGVAQHRERVYLIGYLRGGPRPEIFPLRGETTGTLDRVAGDSGRATRVYDPEGISKTLVGNAGGLGAKTGLYLFRQGCVKNRGELKPRPDGKSTCVDKNYYKGLDNHGQRTAVVEQKLEDSSRKIRRLTPLEAFRLQGFPDWAHEEASKVNSDSQLYRQAGNAVTVPVVEALGRKLKEVFR